MKKKSAIPALLLAGVMSLGVLSAGCKKPTEDDGHIHTWSTSYTSDGASGHHRTSTCTDHEPVNEATESHSYQGDVCTKCNYNKSKGDENDEDDKKPVVLSEDTAIVLTKGGSKELSAAEGATWSSDSPNVVTVDSNGKVTAKAAGVAKVKATTSGSEITCTVIVQDTLPSYSQTTAKDPFKFNNDGIDIGSVDISDSGPADSDPDAEEYTVKFSDEVAMQYVANGSFAVEPVSVERSGSYLQGWYSDSSYNTKFDFGTPVTKNYNLYAKWGELPSGMELAQGNFESIALEWSGSAEGATVSYKPSSSGSWMQINSQLIRDNDGTVRADVVGISAGEYDVKVNTGSGEKLLEHITVKKYDRSGYAHFNYTEGVGAYKDDGTIKENTLVIYLSESNKNDILNYCYVDGTKVDISQYMRGSDGTQYKGIGELLNNRRYSGNDRANVGISRLTKVYGAVVVRVLGKVEADVLDGGYSSLVGLTNYAKKGGTNPETGETYAKGDPVPNGGTVGDNGRMARIVNATNLTIEGIGDDAEIKGWGIHFISAEGASVDEGKSFEVRNITFNAYPEDAVGMEGVQSGGKITSAVERCWVHNNTFLPGYCAAPAESDKAEGDGSCDFKRGMYFTCSYNYFEYCHKTNLVGSADDSLQYNLTYHHNMWYQCGSRIPLTRQANVHFYNNYVFGDQLNLATPYSHISKASLSYVHSLRANCYIFSEANYYDGCKNVTDSKNGGNAKGWGNTYYSCAGTNSIVDTKTRTDQVASECAYNGTSYQNFDTNASLFYYDATTKQTKVEYLDDSVPARTRVVMYSGALGHGEEIISRLNMNNTTPKSAVVVKDGEGTVIDIASGATGKEVDGVLFCGTFAGKSGKGKGTLAVFTLTAEAMVTVTGTGAVSAGSDCRPQIVRSDGKVFAEKFDGTVRVVLPAGTYAITAGLKDKEATITELKFENTAASADARKTAAREALEAIPQKITRSSGDIIAAAGRAYNGLLADEKAEFAELYQRYLKAVAAYDNISVSYVIERIKYIGTVTPASKSDIDAAEKAYNALSADAKDKITNRETLIAAQAEFEQFAVQSVKDVISVLPAVSDFNKIVDSKPAIELAIEIFNKALDEYDLLEDEQKGDISVTGVNAAIDTLTAALKPYDVKDIIAALDETAADYMSKAGALKTAYESLTTEQQTLITAEEKAVYDKAIETYRKYVSQAVSITFLDGKPSNNDIIKSTGAKQSPKKTAFMVNAYSTTEELATGLKLESKTELTLTLATKMTVSFYLLNFDTANTIAVDGEAVELKQVDGDNVATITLEAGTYKIARAKSENSLYYMTLVPAN